MATQWNVSVNSIKTVVSVDKIGEISLSFVAYYVALALKSLSDPALSYINVISRQGSPCSLPST